jgi:hypothetical protein
MNCKLALCFTLLLGMACLPAHAQSSMRIDIPFDFAVGDYTLPAGQYYISRGGLLSGVSTVVWIHNSQHSVNVLTNAVLADGKHHHGPSMLFKDDGSQHSLMQVWSGDDIGREVPRPKFDKNTQIAKGQKGEIVEIAALR